MVIQQFMIQFDNKVDTFPVGSNVTGRINLTTTDRIETNGLRLEVKGIGHTEWPMKEESAREHNDVKSKMYSQDETYLNLLITIFGKRKDQPGPVEFILPGWHDFPFKFSIPLTSPPSYEAEFGWVRYSCRAYIDRPLRVDDECIASFKTLGIVDLNNLPDLLVPQQRSKSEKRGWCCCTTGFLYTMLSIPRTGFVPGEIIPVTIEVKNDSKENLDSVTLELKRILTFKAEGKSKTEAKTRVSIVKGRVAAGKRVIWNENLTIPTTVHYAIKNCSLIYLSHELQLNLISSGVIRADVNLSCPITIGTVPLKDISNTQSKAGRSSGVNSVQSKAGRSSADLTPETSGSIEKSKK